MKTAICTISTHSHLYKTNALFDSLQSRTNADFYCLLTDHSNILGLQSLNFHQLSDLQSEIAAKIKTKYQKKQKDKLRWALKSVYVQFLLDSGYERVIYVDNDIYFYASPDFLFEELEQHDFLITPHFYKADPSNEQNWLEANYRVGLYNAGFFAATKSASSILNWWAKCCFYETRVSFWRGLFVDQKYLDLIPILFEQVKVIKHRGCNFAGWNCEQISFKSENSEFYVNNDKLIFVHYSQLTLEVFSKSTSEFNVLYRSYLKNLQQLNPTFKITANKWNSLSIKNIFYYIRWKCIRFLDKF